MQQGLGNYLTLIRLPNVFTVLTNILVGYFSLTAVSEANIVDISILAAASSFLYISGIVFNDYFDLATDRKERPSRPLPSGSVSKRNALLLAITALVAANLAALMVNVVSLIVSASLSAVIIAYDYGAKRGKFGPAVMGLARFLNVFLGASPALLMATELPWTTIFASSIIFTYVYSITLLSRKEAGQHEKNSYGKSIFQSFAMIVGVIASVAILALYLEIPEMSVNIVLFTLVIYFTMRQVLSDKTTQAQRIQYAVRNLVLSIIVLDSIFITAFAGLHLGLLSLAVIVPAVVLAKKLYVT